MGKKNRLKKKPPTILCAQNFCSDSGKLSCIPELLKLTTGTHTHTPTHQHTHTPTHTQTHPPIHTHTHHVHHSRGRSAGGKVFPRGAPGPNKRFTTPVKFRRPPRRRGHVARKQLTFRPIEQPNYYLRQV